MEKRIVILAVIVAAAIILAGVATTLYLQNAGNENTVNYVPNVAPAQMEGWLTANQSDAYIAWEPYVSSAVVGGTGRVLMWSNEIMPNHPCCIVAVSTDFLSSPQGPELTLRFLKAHMDATTWIQDALADPSSTEYDELVNMSVEFTSRSENVVKSGLSHVNYGYEMNSSFVSALETFTNMYMEINAITNETLASRGYSNASEFVNDYVNETYLEDAADITPEATILNPDDPILLGYLGGDLHQIAQVVARNESYFGGQSLFEKYGLNVETLPAFLNGGAVMDAFIAPDVGLDFGYLGAPPSILKRANLNAPTVIIAQANTEGTGLVVSVDSDIHELKDLIGRTVATPGETSIQHLLLKIALEREGIAFTKA
jgi:NitT/TauT family transport system substrate-binding protein